MAMPTRDISRFILPVRVRTRQAVENHISVRLALAGRMADLPEIETADHDPDGVSRSVDVFVRGPVRSIRKQRPPALLCRIAHDGIVVFGLGNSDRHQVLSRGWGRLHRDGVLLFLPRGEDELETTWSILLRAYRSLTDTSAAAVPVRTAWFDDLPSFSRTNLY
ncbi:MAG: hypothetical protein GWN47_09895 [Woeseiaceae bacterium]|nr:hypothetical protein [Woeseiaceae bacterium]